MVSIAGLTIEPIRDSDVVAAVHAETVAFAYVEFGKGLPPPPSKVDLTLMWEERLADPSATALPAIKEGRVLGTVAVRRDPDFAGEGQLIGLHVMPEEWGQGVGTALHAAAVLLLISQAFGHAGLWVIAANAGARRMYEARDWILKADIELDYLGATEVRYFKHLGE